MRCLPSIFCRVSSRVSRRASATRARFGERHLVPSRVDARVPLRGDQSAECTLQRSYHIIEVRLVICTLHGSASLTGYMLKLVDVVPHLLRLLPFNLGRGSTEGSESLHHFRTKDYFQLQLPRAANVFPSWMDARIPLTGNQGVERISTMSFFLFFEDRLHAVQSKKKKE